MLREDLSTKDYKVYVNVCKDGRYRALKYYSDGRRENVSYPRILVEKSIGRSLFPTEDVHHIDGNPKNNDISNLEVLDHVVHCKQHGRENSIYTKYGEEIEVSCFICGKTFTISNLQLRYKINNVRYKNKSGHFFCSRRCSGKYSAMLQSSIIEPIGRDINRDSCELGELLSKDNT